MDDLNLMRIRNQEYENLDREIKRSMKRTAAEVVRLGFFLRKMRDERTATSSLRFRYSR